jgi:hypothetical protein
MEENNCSGSCSNKHLLKLLKDFSKGCIADNSTAKAEVKPLAKSSQNPENIVNEMKYGKSLFK